MRLFTKTHIYFYSIFFSFFISNNISFAQKYNIQQYTANSGLPSNIFDIEFDDLGYIWFASSEGVIKYDGVAYTTYNQDNGLADPMLFDIFIDKQRRLWASTEFGGVAFYQSGNFVYPNELDWIDSTIVHYIGQDKNGDIWLSLDELGFVILDENLAVKTHFTTVDGLPSNFIFHFNFEMSDRVYISTYGGVAIYNYKEQNIVGTIKLEDGLIGSKTYETLIDNNDNLWIATDQGVSIIHNDGKITNKAIVAGSRLGYVFAFEESEDGRIWIGSDKNGLFWIDEDEENHIDIKSGLSSNNVFNLIKSPSGEVWVTTDGNGVNVFIDNDFRIYNESSKLDAYSAYSVIEDNNGTIWVSTENGLSSIIGEDVTNYPINGTEFSNETILKSTTLPNGNILMITNNYSMIEFDGSNYFQSKYASEFSNELISNVEVIDSTVWLMALHKVIKDTHGEIKFFEPETEDVWQTEFNTIFKDSRGLYWIASQGGLIHFKDGHFSYITVNDGLRNNRISHISEDRNGNLWVVNTVGLDVIRGIKNDGNFSEIVSFETEDLYTDETNFLQFDAYGNLWQGTNSGLNYYDLDQYMESRYYQHIHLPFKSFGYGTEFSYHGSLFSLDSTLYFGTYNNGLIKFKFRPGVKKLNYERAPTATIRSIKAGNEVIYNQENTPAITEKFIVENRQNNILIKLSAISEKYPLRILYRYRLKGLQEDWIIDENISQIRYESLPPGNFSLLIQAKVPNSDWSEIKEAASFRIKKPFYFRFWFLTIMVLLVGAFAYALDRGRITLIERRLLQSKVDTQTKDIQNALHEKEVLIKEIHHRVKNNLAVISGLLDLQSRQIEEGPATEALQNSMTRVLAMAKIHEQLYQNEDLANVNFKDFITNLVRSLDNTISNIEFPVLINEHVEDISVDVNVGVPLGLMINEILSNSFKHAFTNLEISKIATIDIVFSQVDESNYYMKIADNGMGSEVNILEMERQSLGITLITSWASQLDAELTYDGSNGSVFEAKIPV